MFAAYTGIKPKRKAFSRLPLTQEVLYHNPKTDVTFEEEKNEKEITKCVVHTTDPISYENRKLTPSIYRFQTRCKFQIPSYTNEFNFTQGIENNDSNYRKRTVEKRKALRQERPEP